MPNIVWTLLVAAATAVVTALATGLFVTPRMEARKKRLGDVHAARDAFSAHMTRIASVCALLQQIQLPAEDEPGWTSACVNASQVNGSAGGSSSTSPPGG